MAYNKYHDIYGRKTIQSWLDDKRRPKGCSQLNMEYFRELKQYEREFSRILIITYFLMQECKITDVRQMFYSAKKQKNLIAAIQIGLRQYMVTQEWQKTFQMTFGNFRRRLDHVFRIIQENIRLTENYPYFQDVGFDRLIDFSVEYPKDHDTCNKRLLEEIANWNAEHPEEVKHHMEKVKTEIENRDRHRAEVREAVRIEKEMRKQAIKAENAEIREMKRNEQEYQKQKRKTDRMFEYIYKREEKRKAMEHGNNIS